VPEAAERTLLLACCCWTAGAKGVTQLELDLRALYLFRQLKRPDEDEELLSTGSTTTGSFFGGRKGDKLAGR